MQLKSGLLTIKVFELTFYILHSQLISHCLRVLVGIRVHGELWGLRREPDPVPTGYRVCPLCPCAVVALQLPEAVQAGEQAAQRSGGEHGVPRNREKLCMCLTIAPLELRPVLFSHFVVVEQESGII